MPAQSPNLYKKLENKMQTSQNKYFHFVLQLDETTHLSQKELQRRLPIKERFNQYINIIALKYFDQRCSH